MSEKNKENPLLFTANFPSPFDNITPVLIANQESSITNTKSNENNSGNESPITPILSNNFPNTTKDMEHSFSDLSLGATQLVSTSSGICPPAETSSGICPPAAPSLGSVPLMPNTSFCPPPLGIEGNINLSSRRPASKYVVPREIMPLSAPPSVSNLPVSSAAVIPAVTLPQFVPPPNMLYPPPPPPSCIANFPLTSGPVQTSAILSPLSSSGFDNVSMTHSSVIPASFDKLASNPTIATEGYYPVIPHWFYLEGKPGAWKPFSFNDSLNLEAAHMQNSDEKVSCEGGHYDVRVAERKRYPVYWEGVPGEVRRCSWFRKAAADPLPVPYSEEAAEKLENEYRESVLTGVWHRQIELPGGERVLINSRHSIHHYQISSPDTLSLAPSTENQSPQIVKRGAEDFDIRDGPSERVDHLVFLVHGIGSVCDLTFRSVEECVNDFRAMGEELLSGHFKSSIESGRIGRVEILPISWHKALHGDATGLDEKVLQITLRSIPKFREFINDTLLDILYFTSPVYCQHIMDTVASEMDRLLDLFRTRNPGFEGKISLGGHSLGSVILFDLLMHQTSAGKSAQGSEMKQQSTENQLDTSSPPSVSPGGRDDGGGCSGLSSVPFERGVAGTGQPSIVYPQISFQPEALFLMGSPVAMFTTVRGIDKLGPDFKLPTCDRVFNIFHPYDPVAYRLETLIDPSLIDVRPVLIPHHKGRKRMHLELKDTLERVGSDLKNKIVDSIQFTWNKFYQIYSGAADPSLRDQIDAAVTERMVSTPTESTQTASPDVKVGNLNEGKRVDYVLQEKPYESFTEYIFALQAHVNYWTSEDTLLMMLKELYKISGVASDSESLHEPTVPSYPVAPSSNPPSSYITPQPHHQQETSGVSATPAYDPSPVPLLSPPVVSPTLSGPPLKTDLPKALRGRPVFDPLTSQPVTLGMDPTASPSQSTIAPPPIIPNMNFSQRGSKNGAN